MSAPPPPRIVHSPEPARLAGLLPLDAVADAGDGLQVGGAEGGVVEGQQGRALEGRHGGRQQALCMCARASTKVSASVHVVWHMCEGDTCVRVWCDTCVRVWCDTCASVHVV